MKKILLLLLASLLFPISSLCQIQVLNREKVRDDSPASEIMARTTQRELKNMNKRTIDVLKCVWNGQTYYYLEIFPLYDNYTFVDAMADYYESSDARKIASELREIKDILSDNSDTGGLESVFLGKTQESTIATLRDFAGLCDGLVGESITFRHNDTLADDDYAKRAGITWTVEVRHHNYLFGVDGKPGDAIRFTNPKAAEYTVSIVKKTSLKKLIRQLEKGMK